MHETAFGGCPPSESFSCPRSGVRQGHQRLMSTMQIWVGLSRWLGVEGNRSSRRAANGCTGWWKTVVLGYCHLTGTCDGVHLVVSTDTAENPRRPDFQGH